MASLKTHYMGIELKNPVIAGASSLTDRMETIQQIEKAGAGVMESCAYSGARMRQASRVKPDFSQRVMCVPQVLFFKRKEGRL